MNQFSIRTNVIGIQRRFIVSIQVQLEIKQKKVKKNYNLETSMYTTVSTQVIQYWKRMEEWNDGTIFSPPWDTHAHHKRPVFKHSLTRASLGVKSLSSNLYDGLNNYYAFSARFVECRVCKPWWHSKISNWYLWIKYVSGLYWWVYF